MELELCPKCDTLGEFEVTWKPFPKEAYVPETNYFYASAASRGDCLLCRCKVCNYRYAKDCADAVPGALRDVA